MFFRPRPATVRARAGRASPAPRAAAACERLEVRQFLAADLVATGIVGRLPQDLISGERGRIPALAVNVNNAGDAAVRGQVVTRIHASADPVLDVTDVQLVEQTSRLNLQSGRGRRVPIRLRDVPAGIPQGAYYLIADVDATKAVPENNDGNNWIASTQTVAIGPPFVNLTATRAFMRPPVRADRNGSLTLTVLNAGNSNTRGSATVNVLFRPVSQATGGTAVDASTRFTLRARQTRPLRIRVPVPALAPGQYTVIATITNVVGFVDANPTDNTATDAPVTIS